MALVLFSLTFFCFVLVVVKCSLVFVVGFEILILSKSLLYFLSCTFVLVISLNHNRIDLEKT